MLSSSAGRLLAVPTPLQFNVGSAGGEQEALFVEQRPPQGFVSLMGRMNRLVGPRVSAELAPFGMSLPADDVVVRFVHLGGPLAVVAPFLPHPVMYMDHDAIAGAAKSRGVTAHDLGIEVYTHEAAHLGEATDPEVQAAQFAKFLSIYHDLIRRLMLAFHGVTAADNPVLQAMALRSFMTLSRSAVSEGFADHVLDQVMPGLVEDGIVDSAKWTYPARFRGWDYRDSRTLITSIRETPALGPAAVRQLLLVPPEKYETALPTPIEIVGGFATQSGWAQRFYGQPLIPGSTAPRPLADRPHGQVATWSALAPARRNPGTLLPYRPTGRSSPRPGRGGPRPG